MISQPPFLGLKIRASDLPSSTHTHKIRIRITECATTDHRPYVTNMDRTSRNKENVPPPLPYPPSSPEEDRVADELVEGLENFDLFLRDRDAIMPPPITPQRRAAMPAPEPDTPEFTEEGESDEPRTEDVQAMDEGEEGEEGEEEEEEEDPEYCKPL